MLMYENQFSANGSNLFPLDVKQHIMGIIDASPTSQIHFHVTTEIPNVYVYLIEHNSSEEYSLFHVFSCDQIGEDYSYQCFSIDQIQRMHELVLQANLT
ncbi:hypothetical protein HW560_10950 [Paenibacillus sp. E222]|uniref:hypothetical protein n=1 Tax=Paenibacillus sp. E222 TaxID=2748863 RepID=UPI0015C58D63|nr:hypothetical protein [Paenibacillus sp. E222]QLG38569.1 hypothetical protein HW560_10950 [Paenibacillus sp. E222]